MRTLTLIAVLSALALALAACGDDDNGDGGGGGGEGAGGAYGGGAADTETEAETGTDTGAGGGAPATGDLKLVADPGGALRFDKESLTADAGQVTIVMDNPSSVPHAVAIDGGGVDESGEVVGEGGVSEVSAELPAGEYSFYCPVGNHRQAGMEGTLTVE